MGDAAWRHRGIAGRFCARAEFRRLDRGARWVLAGVWVDGDFHPAVPEVEPLGARLPASGLVGWIDLPTPIVAPSGASAAAAALEVARTAWPERVRSRVPFAGGAAADRER